MRIYPNRIVYNNLLSVEKSTKNKFEKDEDYTAIVNLMNSTLQRLVAQDLDLAIRDYEANPKHKMPIADWRHYTQFSASEIKSILECCTPENFDESLKDLFVVDSRMKTYYINYLFNPISHKKIIENQNISSSEFQNKLYSHLFNNINNTLLDNVALFNIIMDYIETQKYIHKDVNENNNQYWKLKNQSEKDNILEKFINGFQRTNIESGSVVDTLYSNLFTHLKSESNNLLINDLCAYIISNYEHSQVRASLPIKLEREMKKHEAIYLDSILPSQGIKGSKIKI